MTPGLIFLKLGGSLITRKSSAHTAQLDVIKNIAVEILRFRCDHPDVKILLGHGSGSFGHVPASRHHTRQGVSTPSEWAGFIEVWREARELNSIVMNELIGIGLPAIAIPPCAQVTSDQGKVVKWDLTHLRLAFSRDLLPVIYGDTIFDNALGGTILSTEELFAYLAADLHPDRILIAGIEEGVWADYPQRANLFDTITPDNIDVVDQALARSENTDVTGGMRTKVQSMFDLVHKQVCEEVLIFSGATPGNIYNALCGLEIGTSLLAGGKD